MTRFVITEVELDRHGEVSRGRVHQIVGGTATLPALSDASEVLDRVEIVDLVQTPDDRVYALRGGLPIHGVRIRIDVVNNNEFLESVDAEGNVSAALTNLPKLAADG
jgi:hypothetical protein